MNNILIEKSSIDFEDNGEFILKEKLRAIKEELGEKDDKDEEINETNK